MEDHEKIARLELALRTERDFLRQNGIATTREGVDRNLRIANTLNDFLQNAGDDSKLRFANLLIGTDA
jgi:hypothetical protein